MKSKIHPDEFKHTTCSITNKECDDSCDTCKIAIREMKEIDEEENKLICTFKERTINGIKLKVNETNTAAKSKSVNDIFTAVGIDKNRYEEIFGSPDQKIIDENYPHLAVVLEHLKLKDCIKHYYTRRFPLIVVYKDVVLSVAAYLCY